MASINELLGVSESYQAPERVMTILQDKVLREKTFNDFLDNFGYDVSYDWFYDYFQDKHVDRSKLKQDFTPTSISDVLINGIAPEGLHGVVYEPSAGTGGNIIRAWDVDRKKHSSFDYQPSNVIWWCEEISDRTIPFLLFNLMVRGLNSIVMHGNTLTREVKKIYTTTNDRGWHLDYSELHDLTENEQIRRLLEVKPNDSTGNI